MKVRIQLMGAALAASVSLSGGLAHAQAILPGALSPYQTDWQRLPNGMIVDGKRVSAVDQTNAARPGTSASIEHRREAEKLMKRAMRLRDKGDKAGACELAKQAYMFVHESEYLKGGDMEQRYASVKTELCDLSEAS
jgi:hypothetical protein